MPPKAEVKVSFVDAIKYEIRWKPRLLVLMSGFIGMCTIVVGVLGWQLTLTAGQETLGSLIEEIESLVSIQLSDYVIQASQSLSAVTQMQAKMFQ
ncbi:hypothetical protein HDU98_000497, partial [Podochytrium sp. JEL0797]